MNSFLTNLHRVEHVIAFALADDYWGQRVCVAVVGSVSEEQVRELALDQLSGPTRPKSIFVVESLPHTHSGKVNRSAVPALFA
jgi:long-chain acyl-CoA synthetase